MQASAYSSTARSLPHKHGHIFDRRRHPVIKGTAIRSGVDSMNSSRGLLALDRSADGLRAEEHRTGPERLCRLANQVRATVLEMIHIAESGHIGSSLSCVDVVTVLRFDQMTWSNQRDRDVFVLSKGHAVPAWYAALIVGGDLDRDLLRTLRTVDSPLQGHPDRTRCVFVDVSTGALGQGLSVAIGRAQAKRLRGQDGQVYCVVGDGECQEGQIWEAVMYAGVRRIPNIILVVDSNGMQSDGAVDDTLALGPLADKFWSFRWSVQEIDGHSHPALLGALAAARSHGTGPSVIIAHTRKGYLGPSHTLLNGAHSGLLSPTELRAALDYLEVPR